MSTTLDNFAAQANLLESFEMKSFWKETEDQKTIVGLLEIPGFIESVEKFVITLLEATCCDISKSSLEELLRRRKDLEVYWNFLHPF